MWYVCALVHEGFSWPSSVQLPEARAYRGKIIRHRHRKRPPVRWRCFAPLPIRNEAYGY
jgi:hypothetical protein